MQLFVLILHVICLSGFSRETDSSFLSANNRNRFVNNTCEPTRRLISGTPARLRAFPYIVILKYGGEFMCAGSIIHRNWVLTAAHCCITQRTHEATIVVGTITHMGRVYRVKEFIIQHGYTYIPEELNGGLEYVIHDMALVHLKESIVFNKFVSPIQLSTIDVDYNYVWSVIPGWGVTNYGQTLSPVLNYITVQLVPEKICQRTGWPYATYAHICTSSLGGKSTCYGDSGGPVVLLDQRVQVGVVSTADNRCHCHKANLHTRVSNYIVWIKSYLNRYNDTI